MPIGAMIGAMGNMFSTFANNEMAKQREAMARSENFRYNEMSADAADARTRKLYADLYSPKAQMEQIKEAGLSPSIFSGSGLASKSGVSGAQGGGAGGVNPNVFAADPIGAAVAAAGIAKTKAETENIKADTSNKEANNPNIIKQSNLIDAEILDKLKEAGYKEAVTKSVEVQTQLQKLSYEIELWKKDEGFTYEMIESSAREMYNNSMLSNELYEQAKIKKELDNATFEENVKKAALENSQILTDILLKESEIELNNTQAETLLQNVLINWFNAEIYKLSEKAKIWHMKNQIDVELKKLGMNATISKNENEIKIYTSILQAITSLVSVSMIAKGGIPLKKAEETKETKQSGQPSLPYN